MWCRLATSTHTGAGEPVEVYDARSSGSLDCCCEHAGLYPGRRPSGRRPAASAAAAEARMELFAMEVLFQRVAGLDVGKEAHHERPDDLATISHRS